MLDVGCGNGEEEEKVTGALSRQEKVDDGSGPRGIWQHVREVTCEHARLHEMSAFAGTMEWRLRILMACAGKRADLC
jgi:hypothetical protein